MAQDIRIRKLIGDLRLNRAGFLAVWLVMVFGLTFYNSTYPAGSNFLTSVDEFYADRQLADLWFDVPAAPLSVVDEVRALDAVEAVSGRLVYEVGIENPSAESLITLRLITLPSGDNVNDVVLIEGTVPAENEIVLIAAFARVQGIAIGDTVRLQRAEQDQDWLVRVSGLVGSSEYLIGARGPLQPFTSLSTFGVAYATYETVAAQFDAVGTVNSLTVTVNDGAEVDAVRAEISAVLSPFTVTFSADRRQHAAFVSLNANSNANTRVALVFSMIFLFGSGTIMSVLLARQVDSERRVIGTLRAMGFSRLGVVVYYLAFALLIVITAALVGTPLGYLISGFVLRFFEIGIIGYQMPFIRNDPNIPFMLFGFVAAIIMALIGAFIPAWRAATTDPGLALRPPAPGNVSGLARLSVPGMPLSLRQAVRNLMRAPIRTASTAFGTACGMIIIVVAFATWDSIAYNFNSYYESRDFDFIVTFGTFATADALRGQVAGVEGVEAIETGFIAPVAMQAGDIMFNGMAMVLDDRGTFHRFEPERGEPIFSRSDGVWVGHNLARVLAVEPGDTIRLSAEGLTQDVQVHGIVRQVLGSPIIIPMSLFSQWTPLNVQPANQVYIRANPEQRLEVQRALSALPAVIGVEDWSQTSADVSDVVAFNGNFAYIFLGFGLLLTFVVLFNTINANFYERRNELAIMRMQGVSVAEIHVITTWETLIAVSLGLLLGLIPAASLFSYINSLYTTDVAGNVLYINSLTWIIASVLLLSTAMVTQLLPLRRVARANLGDVSKAVSV